MTKKLAIIILAAGSSSRMGQSKQMLTIQGESLLHRAARIAFESKPDDVIVVLGANESAHRTPLKDLSIHFVSNPGWPNGIGSSIKEALRWLISNKKETELVLFMVCDQPLVTSSHLEELVRKHISTGKPVIASFYANTPGVPVLFHLSMFDRILSLKDSEGAKKIILENPEQTETVDLPGGEVDLDTPGEFEEFTRAILPRSPDS